jgi:hypothetical protein
MRAAPATARTGCARPRSATTSAAATSAAPATAAFPTRRVGRTAAAQVGGAADHEGLIASDARRLPRVVLAGEQQPQLVVVLHAHASLAGRRSGGAATGGQAGRVGGRAFA